MTPVFPIAQKKGLPGKGQAEEGINHHESENNYTLILLRVKRRKYQEITGCVRMQWVLISVYEIQIRFRQSDSTREHT
jgi:hypothetical protein